MSATSALIAAWARSAVVPHGGAFGLLQAHDIAAPVVRALLARVGLPADTVDALVVGNALGAGGNPARMVSLAAGLPLHCASLSVDTQCCSGLDAVRMGVALIDSGQASVVIAGGVEAWSRAPIRLTRPRLAGEVAVAYERPPFAPNPTQDPDLLVSAARYAAQQGYTRAQQDAYALLSHQRAVTYQTQVSDEIVAVNDVSLDLYPRALTTERAARMPIAAQTDGDNASHVGGVTHGASPGQDCNISRLGVSAKADGAAFVLLLSAQACQKLNIQARAQWVSSAAIGCAPETPLLAAQHAVAKALQGADLSSAHNMRSIELHDAFAVQGLSFAQALGVSAERLNPRGGGLARGHPIGASGAVALVRLLANLAHDAPAGGQGLVAVAGAGGVGSAAILTRL